MIPLSHESLCDRRLEEIRWEMSGLGERMKRNLKDGGQRKRHDGQNGQQGEWTMTAWNKPSYRAGTEGSQPCWCKGKAVNVLSQSVPSSTSAIGSDGEPVLPFRHGWARSVKGTAYGIFLFLDFCYLPILEEKLNICEFSFHYLKEKSYICRKFTNIKVKIWFSNFAWRITCQ